MPDADTVWLMPLSEMLASLERAVRWMDDFSSAHRAVADSLTDSLAADSAEIAEGSGPTAVAAGRRESAERLPSPR